MSTPIRPPGGAPAPVTVPTEALESAQPASQEAGPMSTGVKAPAPADGSHPIATELAAGRIDLDSAMNALVDSVADGALNPTVAAAEREQLVALLRSALAGDPSLQALMRDLERSLES